MRDPLVDLTRKSIAEAGARVLAKDTRDGIDKAIHCICRQSCIAPSAIRMGSLHHRMRAPDHPAATSCGGSAWAETESPESARSAHRCRGHSRSPAALHL